MRESARAEANFAAGQQDLLAVGQEVLLDARRPTWMSCAIAMALRQRNVEALTEQLRGADARFNVGEITRTDVEQARARQSLSQAELSVARANLAAAAAFYVQVGHTPGTLDYPRITDLVPSSLEEALALANELNPVLLAAAFDAEAARHRIGVIQADLLPSVSLLEAEFRANHNPSPGVLNSEAGTVLGVFQVPLYQAGRVSSQVRQAKQEASQLRIAIIAAGRAVRETVVRFWNIYVSSADTIESLEDQVAANELALEGVNQEALVNTRTTLDVLDAEQELVLSQVNLADARRNRVVAAYELIAATGGLTAPNLGLEVPYYNPDNHFASHPIAVSTGKSLGVVGRYDEAEEQAAYIMVNM